MSKSPAKDTIKTLNFEQAYHQLEETVAALESGNLPLEEAMNLYQQGMALAKQCGVQLDKAELTIKSLTPSGELVAFDEE